MASAGATGLGLDSSYVYYSDANSHIWRVPIGGGSGPTNLTASVTMPTGGDAPGRLVIDNSRIYWVTGNSNLWAINKDGSSTGTLTPLYNNGSALVAVAVDSTYIYLLDSNAATLSRLVKN